MRPLTSCADYYSAKKEELCRNPRAKDALKYFLQQHLPSKQSTLSQGQDRLSKVATQEYTPTDVNQAFMLLNHIVFNIKDEALHKHLNYQLVIPEESAVSATTKLQQWFLALVSSTNERIVNWADKHYHDPEAKIVALNKQLTECAHNLNALPTTDELAKCKQDKLKKFTAKEQELTKNIQQQKTELKFISALSEIKPYTVESFKTSATSQKEKSDAQNTVNTIDNIKSYLSLNNKILRAIAQGLDDYRSAHRCPSYVEDLSQPPSKELTKFEQSRHSHKLWRETYCQIKQFPYVPHQQLLNESFRKHGNRPNSAKTLIFKKFKELYPADTPKPQAWLDQNYPNDNVTYFLQRTDQILAPLFELEAQISERNDQITTRKTQLSCYEEQTKIYVNEINAKISACNKLQNQIEANNALIRVINKYKARYSELTAFSQDALITEKFTQVCNLLSESDNWEEPSSCKQADANLQTQYTVNKEKSTPAKGNLVKSINQKLSDDFATWKQDTDNLSAISQEKIRDLKNICNRVDDWHNAVPENYKKDIQDTLFSEITEHYYKPFVSAIVEKNIIFLTSCISFITSAIDKKSIYRNQNAHKVLKETKETLETIKAAYEALSLPANTTLASAKTLYKQINSVNSLNKKIVTSCNEQKNKLKNDRSSIRAVIDTIRTFFRHIAYFFDRGQYVNMQHVKIQPQSRHEKAEYCLSSTARFFNRHDPQEAQPTQQKIIPTHGALRRLN